MELQQVIHMKEGESPTSYAKNSSQQGALILKTKPFIEIAIQEIMLKFKQPKRLNIADLGCSIGPNSLLPTAIIMDVIHETCQHLGCACPELQVFLNDLPLNDFNSIFKAIPSFYKKIIEEKGEEFGPCFVSAIPGSFYGRLFPKQSMHFIYSANSLQWRSQGVVEEEKFNCFNIPLYESHRDELEEVIKLEGSFKIIQIETTPWWSRIYNFPKSITTEWQVGIARAVLEPIFASHFGEMIMDDLFMKFKGHLKQRGFHDKVWHLVLLSRME